MLESYLFAIILVIASVEAQYDYSPIVPMRDYKYNYRTLNGWECFEAQGKFCHDSNHQSMFLITGSTNYGHGICCKPDYNG